MSEAALYAGLRELVDEAYHDLKPIEDAPVAVTNWEPDTDTQTEPAELATCTPQATE